MKIPFIDFCRFKGTVTKSNEILLSKKDVIKKNFEYKFKFLDQFLHTYNARIILEDHLIKPTIECPYKVYFCGDDDFSWTRTLKDEEEVNKFMSDLCFKCENLSKNEYYTFDRMIKELGFIFTN